MKVKRIVANAGVSDPAAAKRFYQDILGLDVLMDMGWIVTYGSDELMLLVAVQFSPRWRWGSPPPGGPENVADSEATSLPRAP